MRDASAMKPNPTVRLNANYNHLHLQYKSPPDSLCTLYMEIEGELAVEQYTRNPRVYIRDLQSRYKPSPTESSTKAHPSSKPLSGRVQTPLVVHSYRLETAMEPTSRIRLTVKIRNTTCTYNTYHPLTPSGFCTR
jgi:hypothetical protein